jgi:hypothetical protein
MAGLDLDQEPGRAGCNETDRGMNTPAQRYLAFHLLVGVVATALFVSAGPCMAEQKPPFLGGAGGTLCAEWQEARGKEGSVLAFYLQGWVLGFVSGAASQHTTEGPSFLTDPGSDTTDDDVLTRIDNYCRAHQNGILLQAVLTIVARLYRDQADRMEERLNRYCASAAPNDPRCTKH